MAKRGRKSGPRIDVEGLRERKNQILAEHTSNLKPEQVRFADWWASPKDLRKPATMKELAKELGVRRETLWEWKHNPAISYLRVQLVDLYLLEYDYPSVIQTLAEKAKGGSINACKFFLDAFGPPKRLEVKHSGALGILSELPDETLASVEKFLERVAAGEIELEEYTREDSPE